VVAETDPGAQRAVLHYRALAYDAAHDTTELEITLETGRTHQIRVQSATRGHPVVGDRLYGARRPFGPDLLGDAMIAAAEQASVEDRSRAIALHAWSITFRDPNSDQFRTITAPFPAMWRS
jgi:23S rRNA pseudouridine1911/1915/1917 synthase